MGKFRYGASIVSAEGYGRREVIVSRQREDDGPVVYEEVALQPINKSQMAVDELTKILNSMAFEPVGEWRPTEWGSVVSVKHSDYEILRWLNHYEGDNIWEDVILGLVGYDSTLTEIVDPNYYNNAFSLDDGTVFEWYGEMGRWVVSEASAQEYA